MKVKKLVKVLLSLVLVFGFSSVSAQTIKWSMQGDSLTLDPHAQNEGPTTQVSRQVYEALVQRGLDMKIGPALATKWKACLLYTSPSPRDLSTSRMPSSA